MPTFEVMNRKLLKGAFLLLFTLITNTLFAQQEGESIPALQENDTRPIHWTDPLKMAPMQRYEDSLIYCLDSVYNTTDYAQRQAGNYFVIKLMKNMLRQTNSFDYPFDGLKKKMNIIENTNKTFKLYHWEMLNTEGLSRYFGVIQLSSGKVIPLIDIGNVNSSLLEDTICVNTRWPGAIYYNMIEKETAMGIQYFLMGINNGNVLSNKKIVECMTIGKSGEVTFGAPCFQSYVSRTPKICNRFVAEYQKDSHISLNWDEVQGLIIMDHLESTIGDAAKRYTYVSDGTYDGLRWNGKMWQIIQNAVAISITSEGKAPSGTEVVEKKQLVSTQDLLDLEAENPKPISTKKTPTPAQKAPNKSLPKKK